MGPGLLAKTVPVWDLWRSSTFSTFSTFSASFKSDKYINSDKYRSSSNTYTSFNTIKYRGYFFSVPRHRPEH